MLRVYDEKRGKVRMLIVNGLAALIPSSSLVMRQFSAGLSGSINPCSQAMAGAARQDKPIQQRRDVRVIPNFLLWFIDRPITLAETFQLASRRRAVPRIWACVGRVCALGAVRSGGFMVSAGMPVSGQKRQRRPMPAALTQLGGDQRVHDLVPHQQHAAVNLS